MMTFGMYAMLFLTPLYLQTLGRFSAFAVGLQLLPLSRPSWRFRTIRARWRSASGRAG